MLINTLFFAKIKSPLKILTALRTIWFDANKFEHE